MLILKRQKIPLVRVRFELTTPRLWDERSTTELTLPRAGGQKNKLCHKTVSSEDFWNKKQGEVTLKNEGKSVTADD